MGPPTFVRRAFRNRSEAHDAQATVLLVDDDPLLLGLIARWLSGEPLRVLTAANGLQALNLLGRHSCQLVVADYRLPGMNGVRLLDAVKEKWPDCRRILLTGYADADLVLEALSHKVLSKEMDRGLIKRAILKAALL